MARERARGGGRKRERRGGEGGEAHLGARRSRQPSTGSPRAKEVEERWKRGRGSCCAGKENEIERGRWRAWVKVGAPGVRATG
jgi:hypothetical protein